MACTILKAFLCFLTLLVHGNVPTAYGFVYRSFQANRLCFLSIESNLHTSLISSENSLVQSENLGQSFCLRLRDLQEYKSLHGDCLVPKRYEANPKLGNWVNKQRQLYRKFINGEKSQLNEERINALNDIGFIWDATGMNRRTTDKEGLWNERFNELKLFKEEHGHCRVPIKYAANPKLANWMGHQKTQYNQLKIGEYSMLTEARLKALESLGFEWESRWEILWNKRFDELRQYKAEHGDCVVPINYAENPQLASWVSQQRKSYNAQREGRYSSMTSDRIRKLNDLGFVWKLWDF